MDGRLINKKKKNKRDLSRLSKKVEPICDPFFSRVDFDFLFVRFSKGFCFLFLLMPFIIT